MKTVIEMAREASNTPIDHHATPDLFGISQIERFAELVRADERNRLATKLVQDFKGAFGDDTCASWAVWIKEQ